jgi:hypothetical protein
MSSPYISYLKQLLLFTVVLGAIGAVLSYVLPAGIITPALPYLFLFFIAVTLLGYYFMLKSVEKKFIKFLNTFLLFTTAKLLIYIIVLVVYILMHRWDAIPFGISFFLLYLCFSIHEIVSIVSYSKKLGKN